jgi:hypothetical protein
MEILNINNSISAFSVLTFLQIITYFKYCCKTNKPPSSCYFLTATEFLLRYIITGTCVFFKAKWDTGNVR